MHGLHVYDSEVIETKKDVMDMISGMQGEAVQFLNDFDVPYLQVKIPRLPKLKKKPRKRRERAQGDDDDDDDKEHDEDHEEERDEDDDDDDKDDDDAEKSKKSGEDDGDDDEESKGATKKGNGSDDEDSVSQVSSKKSKKSSSKKEKKKKKKQQKKKPKKKAGSDDEDEDDDKPDTKGASNLNKLSPVQERVTSVRIFMKGLNQNKKHFKDIEANIPPVIVEAPYESDDAADDGYGEGDEEKPVIPTGRRASMVSQTAINTAVQNQAKV